jgi:N-6 DNA Methylase/TaqI-like C-terminal specificity domain
MANSTLEKWVDEWYGIIWADQKIRHPERSEVNLRGMVQDGLLRSLYSWLSEQHHQSFVISDGEPIYPILSPHPPIVATTLGQIYERLLTYNLTAKKMGGAYYTPPSLVDFVVKNTVGQVEGLPTIADPACGGGFFLVAAYQALLEERSERAITTAERKQILLDCIYGVDIDPQAVIVTQVSLLLKFLEADPQAELPDLGGNIQCGNSVIDFDWEQACIPNEFDIILGNPPYVDSEWMTQYLPEWRRYCTSHYKSATGNWDLFCVFIEKSLMLCRTGGLVSLVVPNKLASADYAAGVRSLLATESRVLLIQDYSQSAVFKAAVYPLVFVARKEAGGEETGETWAIASTPQQADLLHRLRAEFPQLGAIAQVNGAATVAEAYEIQNLIREDPGGELRMVNSGTIDRYCFLWGKKPMRYLGQSYWYPVIGEGERLPIKRLQQARQPKIIVSGMTQRLECALDEQGSVLPGKSTSIILPFPDCDLYYLLGILNSRLLSFYFKGYFGGNSLHGGYLRIGSPQIRQMPIALSNRPEIMINLVHQRLAESDLSQSQEIDDEIDQLVYQLYGLTALEVQMLEQTKF